MSLLRDIVMFTFMLQLGLQLTNFVQIQGPSASMPDGLYLSTGEISPFTLPLGYNPMNEIVSTLNNSQKTLQQIAAGGNTTTITFSLDRFLLFPINPAFTQTVDLNYNFLGIPFAGMIWGLINLFFFMAIMASNLVFGLIMVVAIVLFNVTIGAIPFYINLFSKIDPTFGSLLGICLGGIQMFVVGWEIIKYCTVLISALIAMI